jgi:FKBP-type peptidyl-prolyl cis-trans isomerase
LASRYKSNRACLNKTRQITKREKHKTQQQTPHDKNLKRVTKATRATTKHKDNAQKKENRNNTQHNHQYKRNNQPRETKQHTPLQLVLGDFNEPLQLKKKSLSQKFNRFLFRNQIPHAKKNATTIQKCK